MESLWALKNFLAGFRKVNSDDVYNVLSHGDVLMGKYYIPPEGDSYNQFIDLYNQAMTKNRLSILEKPTETHGVIKIDFDFRLQSSERLITNETIKKICSEYINCMKNDLQLSNQQVECWVFMRDSPYVSDKNVNKDGIHILFPSFHVSYEYQHFLRRKMLSALKEILEPMSNESIDKIIDESVVDRNSWYLHGSSKPGTANYNVKFIYDGNMNDIKNQKLREIGHGLTEYLSIQIKKEIVPVNIEIPVAEQPHKMKKLNNCSIAATSNGIIIVRKKKDLPADVEMAKKLLRILSPERADDDTNRLYVGWASYNISPSLHNDWQEFCKKSESFDENICKLCWDKFGATDVQSSAFKMGISSLHFWAKQDSPSEYWKAREEKINEKVDECIKIFNHHNVAEILYERYKYEFVCTSIRSKTWYQFQKHRWTPIYNGFSLKSFITTEVIPLFTQKALSRQAKQADPDITEEERKAILAYVVSLNKYISKLGDANFRESVIKEAAELFFQSKFEENLDNNNLLVGFENGVYDLEIGKLREGIPDDMVSLSTGIPYIEYNYDHHLVRDTESFIEKTMPIERVRDYLMVFLASSLQGNNATQKFHIFTGSGSNGKSMLLDFFEQAIGRYAVKLPVSLITQKRGHSSAAAPELARCRGARWASLQEPDEDTTINTGLMKELSGNDKIFVRSLYSDGFEYRPMFNLVMCCNHLPKIKAMDGGTWRRIRVVEFVSKFVTDVNNAEETYGHKFIFPRDPTLSSRIPELRTAFMWLLLNKYYKMYQEQGLVDIEEVNAITKMYKQENDYFFQYFSDNIRVNQNAVLELEQVYSNFKTWFTSNFCEKIPTLKDFKSNMEKRIGMYNRSIKGWNGYEINWGFEQPMPNSQNAAEI